MARGTSKKASTKKPDAAAGRTAKPDPRLAAADPRLNPRLAAAQQAEALDPRAARRAAKAARTDEQLTAADEEKRADLNRDSAVRHAYRRHSPHTTGSAADENTAGDVAKVGDAVYARPYGSGAQEFDPKSGKVTDPRRPTPPEDKAATERAAA